MRFKNGTIVEVMNKTEVPISWRCAEVLSGNGYTYAVRFCHYPDIMNETLVERVSRKLIRPCPPQVQGAASWVAGDIMEVFDKSSWKMATVMKVLQQDHYLVRLLGCSREVVVTRSSIRPRQSWQDNVWILMGKGSEDCRNMGFKNAPASDCCRKMSFHMPQSESRVKFQARKRCLPVQRNSRLEEPAIVSFRTPKRKSPYCSSAIDSLAGDTPKRRMIQAPLMKKVDAVAYPSDNLGEPYMHSSYNNRSCGINEFERANLSIPTSSSSPRSSENNDTDSNCSSVGSCSGTHRSIKLLDHHVQVPYQATDSLCSDAESSCGSEDLKESCPPIGEEIAAGIHMLELHAYRCTLEALYASGPLSWEQESMLTNLRIMLHISNDEHLMELKNLISAKTGNSAR